MEDSSGNAVLELFNKFMFSIFSPECYNIFFINFNFFHVPCLKASVSKILGLGIIAGSILVKVPQIIKIIKNRSGAGISVVAQLLELYGIIANVSYSYIKGFPFSSWGDGIFMLIQTASIIILVLFFGMLGHVAILFASIISVSVYLLTSGLVPVSLLWTMQAISVPIMFLGKAIQAYSNYSCKSMGQQSIITSFLLLAGSLARIFTSVQETGDSIMILTYSLASLVNGIIFTQFFIYRSKSMDISQKSSKKRN